MDGDDQREIDLELIERCASGDDSALAELYDRHGALCRRRAVDVLRNEALAEEAVQDAFLDLWRTAADFDAGRAAVRTWLCVLVHRRAVDLARREARHRVDHDDAESVDPASYTGEEVMLLQLERRRVRAALDHLGPLHRQVVDLAYWGGMTQSQIAAHCGIPVGTVKSRTSDALARLATLLPRGAFGEA